MNTKPFWQALAKAAVKVAVYAADHPEQVKAIVDVVTAAKKPDTAN